VLDAWNTLTAVSDLPEGLSVIHSCAGKLHAMQIDLLARQMMGATPRVDAVLGKLNDVLLESETILTSATDLRTPADLVGLQLRALLRLLPKENINVLRALWEQVPEQASREQLLLRCQMIVSLHLRAANFDPVAVGKAFFDPSTFLWLRRVNALHAPASQLSNRKLLNYQIPWLLDRQLSPRQRLSLTWHFQALPGLPAGSDPEFLHTLETRNAMLVQIRALYPPQEKRRLLMEALGFVEDYAARFSPSLRDATHGRIDGIRGGLKDPLGTGAPVWIIDAPTEPPHPAALQEFRRVEGLLGLEDLAAHLKEPARSQMLSSGLKIRSLVECIPKQRFMPPTPPTVRPAASLSQSG